MLNRNECMLCLRRIEQKMFFVKTEKYLELVGGLKSICLLSNWTCKKGTCSTTCLLYSKQARKNHICRFPIKFRFQKSGTLVDIVDLWTSMSFSWGTIPWTRVFYFLFHIKLNQYLTAFRERLKIFYKLFCVLEMHAQLLWFCGTYESICCLWAVLVTANWLSF